MLNTAWLIVHLIASAMPGAAAAAGPAGVTCTYQACMAKCSRLNGSICNSYCDAKISQRVSVGICAAQQNGLAPTRAATS
ncbi:hypothetical protein YH63_021010 [Afipia massiliensis]|uniref:DUF3551 domain-containing protein n=1 Tax=Afipia massiliensis TaxID=211460 RepID=A0A4V6Y1F9_9BRAD|nr:hypothetical protein [Afipia massiliensis]TKT73703.1 hypothetical protein YH63_021010 [Afipia massiliensis]